MDFYIMNRDSVAGKWQSDRLIIENESLLPLYLKNTGNVKRWLETRAIDYHRANSRLLKKALRLTEKDDISIVLTVNAVTIRVLMIVLTELQTAKVLRHLNLPI